MRKNVIKGYHERERKMAEMDFVIEKLNNYKKTLGSRTGDLFKSSG